MSVLKSAPFRAVLGLAVAAGLIFAVGAVDEDPADAEGGTAAVQDGPVLGEDIVSVSDLNIGTFGMWMGRIGKGNCDQTRAGYVCQNLVYANPGDTSPTWTAALYLSGSGLPGRGILTKIRVDHGETFSYESDRSLSQGTYILLTSDEPPAGHEWSSPSSSPSTAPTVSSADTTSSPTTSPRTTARTPRTPATRPSSSDGRPGAMGQVSGIRDRDSPPHR